MNRIIEQQKKLLNILHNNRSQAQAVYDAAIFGYEYHTVKYNQLLHKFGSKKALERLETARFEKMKKLLESRTSSKTIKVQFTAKELDLIKKVLEWSHRMYQKIPSMARRQYLISLETTFEAFISDTFRNIFSNIPESLKSSRTTLKDEELIDSIRKGNSLQILCEKRIRDIMYGSESSWISHLQQLGLAVTVTKDIVELGLIRNCLIHNNGLVSKELCQLTKRYKEGNTYADVIFCGVQGI